MSSFDHIIITSDLFLVPSKSRKLPDPAKDAGQCYGK